MHELHEGYNIIVSEAVEDRGMVKASQGLAHRVREASELWDIEYIGGAKIEDDPGGGKNCYVALQTVVLSPKKKFYEGHNNK